MSAIPPPPWGGVTCTRTVCTGWLRICQARNGTLTVGGLPPLPKLLSLKRAQTAHFQNIYMRCGRLTKTNTHKHKYNWKGVLCIRLSLLWPWVLLEWTRIGHWIVRVCQKWPTQPVRIIATKMISFNDDIVQCTCTSSFMFFSIKNVCVSSQILYSKRKNLTYNLSLALY